MKPKMRSFLWGERYPTLTLLHHIDGGVVPPGWRVEGVMIDWTRVADLRSEIGEDGFAEVIDLFLEETDEVILRLSQASPSPAIGRDLHFLKGSALNLGFSDLAQLCADGERLAMANDGLGVDLGRILRCYQASKMSFQDGLVQASAA